MNWAGTQKGEGFEYHLPAPALLLVVMARGAGGWSLDRLIAACGPRAGTEARRKSPAAA